MTRDEKVDELVQVLKSGVYALDSACEMVGLDPVKAQAWYDAGEVVTATPFQREFRAAVDRGRRLARASIEAGFAKAATGGWSPTPPEEAIEVACPHCEEVLPPATVAAALPPTYFQVHMKYTPPSHQAAKAYLEKVSPDVWGKQAVDGMTDEALVDALLARPKATMRSIVHALMRAIAAPED